MVEKKDVQNVLLIGRTSYVGAYLETALKEQDINVTALSSSDCDFLDPIAVKQLFQSLPKIPHTIVFCAVLNKWKALSHRALVDNTTLVENLIAYHGLACITNIIHFSTVEVYGKHPPVPLTEKSPVDPDSWYSLAKYIGEWMLLSSGRVTCPVTILRIPGIYGCWPNDHSVIGKMVHALRQEGAVSINGDGTVQRDYVYLPDLARVVIKLLSSQYLGVVNVGTGRSMTIATIADSVCRVLGHPKHVTHVETDIDREFDLVFDTTILRSLLPGIEFSDIAIGIQSYG